MKWTLHETIGRFLKDVRNSEPAREHIKGVEIVLQFVPTDGDPCHLGIRQGRLSLGKGAKHRPDVEKSLYITGDLEAMVSLLTGGISLAEAIYDHRIQIAGYRKKEPLMVWFSRLLRRGRGIKD